MTELDRLPPDQRAVLSLLLERGKSYSEVAEMLAIPESAVRDRAHAALDALANDGASIGSRSKLGDRSASTPATTPGAGEIPRAKASGARAPGSSSPSPSPPRPGAAPSSRASAGSSRTSQGPQTSAGSRRAGAILLGAIVVAIVVAVVLITDGGGKSSPHPSTTTSNANSTTTTSTGKSKVSLDKTITLSPVEPTLKATGKALVLSENGRYAFYIAAHGLPASLGFFYAVWLYNSPSSAKPLGRAPTVSAEGVMEGGGPLPTNAANYGQLIITRETSTHPTHPGPAVMSGRFALH
jgi:hypothetical protein